MQWKATFPFETCFGKASLGPTFTNMKHTLLKHLLNFVRLLTGGPHFPRKWWPLPKKWPSTHNEGIHRWGQWDHKNIIHGPKVYPIPSLAAVQTKPSKGISQSIYPSSVLALHWMATAWTRKQNSDLLPTKKNQPWKGHCCAIEYLFHTFLILDACQVHVKYGGNEGVFELGWESP